MSGTDAPKAAAIRFEGVTPIFRVRSLPASIDYYVRVLGFKVDWHHPGIIASVSRDRCGIFLCEGDQGNPGTRAGLQSGERGGGLARLPAFH